jgi:hypothetical protein
MPIWIEMGREERKREKDKRRSYMCTLLLALSAEGLEVSTLQ